MYIQQWDAQTMGLMHTVVLARIYPSGLFKNPDPDAEFWFVDDHSRLYWPIYLG